MYLVASVVDVIVEDTIVVVVVVLVAVAVSHCYCSHPIKVTVVVVDNVTGLMVVFGDNVGVVDDVVVNYKMMYRMLGS